VSTAPQTAPLVSQPAPPRPIAVPGAWPFPMASKP
jgi:hypothetical protein